MEMFKRESSDIDWCEPNYVVSPFIAEFYNTVSNLLFVVLPPMMMYLYNDYGRYISYGCHLVWLLMVVIGVGSMYFHSTLSLAGQLLDELAILWVFNATFALWIPKRLLPQRLLTNTDQYYLLVAVFSVVTTIIGFIYPIMNNVLLMVVAIPTAFLILKESKSCKDDRAGSLGYRGCILWMIAICIWISDKFMCGIWLQLRFPYLHAIWHVIMAVASYDVITFLAFQDTESRFQHMEPVLRYWPSDDMPIIGMPYIKFMNALALVQTDKPYSFAV